MVQRLRGMRVGICGGTLGGGEGLARLQAELERGIESLTKHITLLTKFGILFKI